HRQVDHNYKETLKHFLSRKAMVGVEVGKNIGVSTPTRLLAIANLNLGRNILAALTLGNMDYLNPDVDWIEGLLVNHHQMPPDVLDGYLETYYQACVRHLDQPGMVVVEWLSRLLGHPMHASMQQRHIISEATQLRSQR
ncbi:MAG: hypothetical protein ACK4SA_20450, partial [Caldilinea sp.]